MSFIEVTGLTKCFGKGSGCTWALNGVELEVSQGNFCVLEGRSGSGKTTLLNCIGALQSPTSGQIFINGQDYHHLGKDQLASFRLQHIGFIFQAYNLMAILSARENVAYILQLKGMKESEALAIADQWLEKVGLAEQRNRRPQELSGGQQQRVAVARALAGEPDLILADEPTANLDTKTGMSLIELMLNLNRELGITFLVSTHDPAVIDSAQSVATLKDGRVVKYC